MKAINSIINGWKLNLKTFPNILIMYFSGLFLSGWISLSFLTSKTPDNVLFETLSKQLNATALIEMLRNYEGIFNSTFSQIAWVILSAWLLSVFFTGGIISSFYFGKFTHADFWKNSFKFFFRNLRISLYSIVLYIVVLAVYVFFIKLRIEHFNAISSVETNYYRLIYSLIVLIPLLIFIKVVTEYAKFTLYLTEQKIILKTLWRSVKYVLKNPLKVFTIYVSILGLSFLLFVIYLSINKINYSAAVGITLIFIIKQVIIFIRIKLNLWNTASLFSLYTFHFNRNIDLKKAEFAALDDKAEQISNKDFNKEKDIIRNQKEEKAKATISDMDILLKNMKNKLITIEKEALPEEKEKLLNNLQTKTDNLEWEILDEDNSEEKKLEIILKEKNLLKITKQDKLQTGKKEDDKNLKTNNSDEDIFEFE